MDRPPDVGDPSDMDPSTMESSVGTTDTRGSALALLTRRTCVPTPQHGDASLLHVGKMVKRSTAENSARTFTVARTNEVLTYAGMYNRSCRIADVLCELGVETGDSVGVFLPNCVQVRACTGCWS
jgi:hypothetical protein